MYTCPHSNQVLLDVPRARLKNKGDRAFSVVAPNVWNSLPVHIRTAQSVGFLNNFLRQNCIPWLELRDCDVFTVFILFVCELFRTLWSTLVNHGCFLNVLYKWNWTEHLTEHLIYSLITIIIKKHCISHYCDSILQFIVTFICLLTTRQKIVYYTLNRDCIWRVILTKTTHHIFLNFYFRSIHIYSVYLKYLEPWNFKVPKPWACTWI